VPCPAAVFGARPVTVVLIRDPSAVGYDLALVTTDTDATAAQVIERYASRWSIEVAIGDAREVFDAGQACNRTACAVERAVPLLLACQAITTCWYATARPSPPPRTWPPSSAVSSSSPDLRHLVLTSHPEEINVIRLAWEDLAA